MNRPELPQSLTLGRSPFSQRARAPGNGLSFRSELMREPCSTTTGTGLTVACELDANAYEMGIKAHPFQGDALVPSLMNDGSINKVWVGLADCPGPVRAARAGERDG